MRRLVDLFLRFVQLPVEDRPLVRSRVEAVARSPDQEARGEARRASYAYLTAALDSRRRNPGTDLFSRIVAAEAEGRICPADSVSMALNILFGGIETVTSALSFIMRFLSGPHRCLASNLARPELRIFLEGGLSRIPEFDIAPGKQPKGHSGAAMAITYLPIVWPTA